MHTANCFGHQIARTNTMKQNKTKNNSNYDGIVIFMLTASEMHNFETILT